MARFVALFALVVVAALAVLNVEASPRPTGTPRPAAPEYVVTIRRNSPNGNLKLACRLQNSRPNGFGVPSTILQTSFSEGAKSLLASIIVQKVDIGSSRETTPLSAGRDS
ncbi:hypothetical protein TYRP_018017 [Tyrophagus putrescentiae]|nr:hypothetical protein TYRP_018017 [Tyrophagus putrescentiae]